MIRKGIGVATVTLHIKTYKNENGETHIDIEQDSTGGWIKGTTERRLLTGEMREHSDPIFGDVKGSSRWIKIDEIEDEFLKSEWLPGTEYLIESNVDSIKNGWSGYQIWGFKEINGERRYARNVVVKKGAERKQARLVYDYKK